MPTPRFDKETQRLVNKARRLGGKGLPIYLDDPELVRLCAVVAIDLAMADLAARIATPDELPNGYYGLALDWFIRPVPEGMGFVALFADLRDQIEDFATYFLCLCEIHKRRKKYDGILKAQAIPRIETIVPRSLLEYGMRPNDTLASWLVWRKWIYDIDNRSAQETGYLFEPILTAALGGSSYSHKRSPIKRSSDPTMGRQVDCIDAKTAYEFKMRVTIAASGQGRFREELDFAKDCKESGFTPVLLVLDPTPSIRLDDLSKEYIKYGGAALIGEDAWDHLKAKGGKVMGRFVERYIKKPLVEVDQNYRKLLPLSVTDDGKTIAITLGDREFKIARAKPEEQIEGSDEGADADRI